MLHLNVNPIRRMTNGFSWISGSTNRWWKKRFCHPSQRSDGTIEPIEAWHNRCENSEMFRVFSSRWMSSKIEANTCLSIIMTKSIFFLRIIKTNCCLEGEATELALPLTWNFHCPTAPGPTASGKYSCDRDSGATRNRWRIGLDRAGCDWYF